MRAPTGQSTIPGAPVDPAIISASFADTSKPQTAKPDVTKKTEEAPAVPAEKPKTAEKAATAQPTPPTKAFAEKPIVQASASKPNVAATIPPTRAANKEGGATATVEKDVHEAFKEFNKSEKLRVQEHQRSMARRDKAVKLNDLKKFAQNFKLNTEVPTDLLPILARDEVKQREISEKAKRNADEIKSTPPRSTATSVAATPSDTKSKPTTTRNDSGPTSPLASTERQPQQRSRQSSTNMGGSMKGVPAHVQAGQGVSHRQPHGNLGQRLAMNTQINRGVMPQHPVPILDPRMAQSGITSPTSALRWDPTKSFIPSAASKPFVPGGSNASSGSSPVRAPSSQAIEPIQPKPGNLFEGRAEGRKGIVPESERITLDNAFNPIPTLKKEQEAAEATLPENKRGKDNNGGLPPPHRTIPTWHNRVPDANKDKTYKDMFPDSLKPAASPQHIGPNHFQHQLPYSQHQGFSQQLGMTPSHTPHRIPAQPHHGGPGTPHHYEDAQRMQFSHSTSSVQPSPQPRPQFIYNPQGGPPGQQFPPGVVYGSSPGGGFNLMTRQLSNNPQFHGQPQMVAVQGPPGAYMQPMPGQMVYSGGGQAFFPHGAHMAPPPGTNSFPSPANRPVILAQQNSQSGHNTPQGMTPYFHSQGPGMFVIRTRPRPY
jgi:hypothetical protein